MEYYVFTLNNRQYWASLGETIKTDKISGEIGNKIKTDAVQLVLKDEKVEIGAPNLADFALNLEIAEQGKEKKQHGLKYKAKGNYRRHWGFRREFSKIKILGIA